MEKLFFENYLFLKILQKNKINNFSILIVSEKQKWVL